MVAVYDPSANSTITDIVIPNNASIESGGPILYNEANKMRISALILAAVAIPIVYWALRIMRQSKINDEKRLGKLIPDQKTSRKGQKLIIDPSK